MRTEYWLKTSFALLLLGGAAGGVGLVGCTGDDATPVAPKTDAGADATVTPDGGGADGGGGTDTGADTATGDASDGAADAGPRARILVVHAGVNVDAVRICFATGADDTGADLSVSPVPALPHLTQPGQPYPGIFPGTGGTMPDLGQPLGNRAITGFVIPADAIKDHVDGGGPTDSGAEADCLQLIGSTGQGGILPAGSFVKLQTIPKGTFLNGKTILIAAVGCQAEADAAPADYAAMCGAGANPATGNLGAKLFDLDTLYAGDGGSMGVQVIQASPALDGIPAQAAGEPVNHAVGLSMEDGGLIGLVNPSAGMVYGDIKPASAALFSGATDPTHNIFVSTFRADGGTVNQFGLPLSVVAKLTNGVGTLADGGAYFQNQMNYTFILLGNPADPNQLTFDDGGANPNYDGRGVHIIAFPNVFTAPKFQ